MKDKELVKLLVHSGPVKRVNVINKLLIPFELQYVLNKIIFIAEMISLLRSNTNLLCSEQNKLYSRKQKAWIRINQYRHKIWNFKEFHYK